MCPPPRSASFFAKLRHDFNNTYYKYSVAYIAVMVTLIFASIVLGWGKA